MPGKKVVIYARLSVAREESVSIRRQIESAQKYAEARGWTVIGDSYVDDGVSATRSRPEDRLGWQRLLSASDHFDAVLVWKIDRLSRKVLDFLHADQALQERGAGIVCVTDPVDMTTPQGRAFAVMLSVFAEMEAEAIRTRVKASRDFLVKEGRLVGGTVPYGWHSVVNPDGHGFVLAIDGERIEYVRGMAERALEGDSVYSICKWLNDESAPLPRASQSRRKYPGWSYSTVDRLLRNPALAGMTPYHPGRSRHGTADPWAVLRGTDGLPVVDDAVAILSADERRRLLAALDNRETPQARPRASRGVTSPLLAGLLTCGHCFRTMYRGSTQKRPSLSCPSCHQTISRNQLDLHMAQRLLDERGTVPLWETTDLTIDNSADLRMIEEAIEHVTREMGQDGSDLPTLLDRLHGLKELRGKTRLGQPSQRTWRITGRSVREAWEAADGDHERRQVLQGQVDKVTVVRGKVGRYLDPHRVRINWKAIPDGMPLPDGTRLGPRVEAPLGTGGVGAPILHVPDGSYRAITSNS